MILGDFNINGFVGSKNKMMITHRPDTKIPERSLMFNDNIPSVDRAIVFDNRNYKNRSFELEFLIQAESYEERVKIYTEFMSKVDTGQYVPAVFYSDDKYEYHIIRTGEITTDKPAFFEELETFSVHVSAEPFKYLRDKSTASISGTEIKLTNPTPFMAKPYIKISGTGSINLFINGYVYSFTNVSGSIELDSAMQEVWRMDVGKAVNENPKMTLGPFPELKTGVNTLRIDGGSAIIEPRWRTL